MKWICIKCTAINPQFSNSCHNCGELSEVEKENRRGWLPNDYQVIVCPECGSGCCYCGLDGN